MIKSQIEILRNDIIRLEEKLKKVESENIIEEKFPYREYGELKSVIEEYRLAKKESDINLKNFFILLPILTTILTAFSYVFTSWLAMSSVNLFSMIGIGGLISFSIYLGYLAYVNLKNLPILMQYNGNEIYDMEQRLFTLESKKNSMGRGLQVKETHIRQIKQQIDSLKYQLAKLENENNNKFINQSNNYIYDEPNISNLEETETRRRRFKG